MTIILGLETKHKGEIKRKHAGSCHGQGHRVRVANEYCRSLQGDEKAPERQTSSSTDQQHKATEENCY